MKTKNANLDRVKSPSEPAPGSLRDCQCVFGPCPAPVTCVRDRRIFCANQAFMDLFKGIRREAIVGRIPSSLVMVADRAPLKRLLAAAQKGGTPAAVRARSKRSGGDVLDLEVSAISAVMGGAPAVCLFWKDVSEWQRSRSILEAALKEHDVATIVSDKGGRFIWMNDAVRLLTGYRRREIPDAKTFVHRLYPAVRDRRRVWNAARRNLLGQRVDVVQSVLTRKDGQRRQVLVSTSFFHGGNIVFLRDLTAQCQAEELLRIQRDIATALSADVDFRKAMSLVLEAALTVEGIDCGGVYMVDARSGAVDLVAHRGLSARFVETVSHYDADAPQGKHVLLGKAEYRDCVEVQRIPLQKREGLRSVAVIPIRFEGRSVAALNLGSHTVDGISAPARTALEAIAAQIGVVVVRVQMTSALRESQTNLQTIFDHIDDMLFVVGRDRRLIDVNPGVLDKLGYAKKALIGRDVLFVHPPSRRAEAGAALSQMMAGRDTVCTVPLMGRGGQLIPVETLVTRGSWDGMDVLFGVSRDVSARLDAEAALRDSGAKLRALLNATSDAAFLMRRDGTITAANDPFGQVFSRRGEEIIGRRGFDLLSGEVLARRRKHIDRAFRTGKPVLLNDERDGRCYENRIFPVTDSNGKVVQVAVFARDITDRLRLEQEVLRISEFEKQRVGQDLHDTLVQHLAGTAMLSDALAHRLAAGGSRHADEALRLGQLARDAVAQARRIARGLSPASLAEGGLAIALRRLAEDTKDMFRVPSLLAVETGDRELDDALAAHLYFIAREAVSNAVRHAKPSRIRIKLAISKGKGTLTIRDNGRGIPDNSMASGGLGLRIMRYRAETVGGMLSVTGGRHGGTVVTCSFEPRFRPSQVRLTG